jgi:hypothetical protein
MRRCRFCDGATGAPDAAKGLDRYLPIFLAWSMARQVTQYAPATNSKSIAKKWGDPVSTPTNAIAMAVAVAQALLPVAAPTANTRAAGTAAIKKTITDMGSPFYLLHQW